MQDRYLFRGKRIDNGGWYVGYYLGQTNGLNITEISSIENGFRRDIDLVTVGQCTGLRDKNGTLIFEGDLLKNEYGEIYDANYCAEWGAYRILCHIYKDKDGSLIEVSGGAKALDEKRALKFVVIGNIHDNPELLEVRNETD